MNDYKWTRCTRSMSQQLVILNSKDAKKIHEQLREQYGYSGRLDAALFLHPKQEKLYLFTRDIGEFDISTLRIDAMGLYFGAYYQGQLRLTVEGSQIVGPQCTENIIEVTKQEMGRWLSGEKLQLSALEIRQDLPESGAFVIIRCGTDHLGCGKVAGDVVLNYVPKTRHIHALYDEHKAQ